MSLAKIISSVMKDGAVVCNSGHFDIEIDFVALKKLAPLS